MRDILILSKWFKGLEDAPDEVLQILGYRIIKELVLNKEEINTSNDDWNIKKIWFDIKKDALGTYDSYKDKKEYGKEHGKKMNPISIEVWKYCKQHEGAKAKEVGEYLQSCGFDITSNSKKGLYSKVYDLPGWKNKNNKNWLKELGISENSDSDSEKNSEEIIRNSIGIPEF